MYDEKVFTKEKNINFTISKMYGAAVVTSARDT